MDEEQLAAVTGGTNGEATGGSADPMALIVPTTDIQTVIQMVQAGRADLVESRIIDQVQEAQQHNDTGGQMNGTLASLYQDADYEDPRVSYSETLKADLADAPARDTVSGEAGGIAAGGDRPDQVNAASGELKMDMETALALIQEIRDKTAAINEAQADKSRDIARNYF